MELREDVGTALRRARAERGLSRDAAAEAMEVPEEFLADIEDGRLAAFGSSLHAAAYVRMYARYLGVDPDQYVTSEEGIDHAEVEPRLRRRRAVVALAVALLTVGALVAVVTVLALTPGGGGDVAFEDGAADQPGPDRRLDASGDTGEQAGEEETAVRSDAVAGTQGEPDESGDGGAGRTDPDDETGGTGSDTSDTADSVAEDAEDPEDPEDQTERIGEGLRVQVLNGADDASRLRDATAVLDGLGYEVVFVDRTLQTFETTTVLRDEDWAAEAEALLAADERFVTTGDDPGFNVDAELHVIVGLDWPEG